MTRSLLVSLALALALVACGRGAEPSAQPGAANTATVAAAPIELGGSSYVGVFLIEGAVDLRAEVAGRVEAVPVQLGARVKAGQLLMSLATPELDAELMVLEGTVEAARAKAYSAAVGLKSASARWARRREFPEGLSAEDLALAEADAMRNRAELAAVRAGVGSERARLLRIKEQVERKFIRAPFDGVVGLRKKEINATVQVGDALLRIIPDRPPILRFAVPPADAEQVLREGQRLSLKTESGSEQARVARASRTVDLPSGMVIAEATVDCAADGCPGILDGMPAEVRVRR